MPKRQTLLVLVIVITGLMFAQTSDSKPPAASTGSAVTSKPSEPPTNTPPFDQLEVLSDTKGVDFGPYLTQVVKMVKQNWFNLMPPSAYPPDRKQGKVAIEFLILKDGNVRDMKIDSSSGDVPLDRAAWASLTASSPFAALPKEFPGESLHLRFYYYHNPQSITILPITDVRVAAGSMQQFYASGKGISPDTVNWTISGPACSKSPCGTITADGLYTAPADIPNPPTVFIGASVRTGVTVPAKTKLTIVPAVPPH